MSRNRWSVVILAAILILCLLLTSPCLERVRIDGEFERSINNMKQVGLALQSYHDAHGELPPAVVRDKDGRPLYSWRVLLLPFMDHGPLHNQFRLDDPWDSPHNLPLCQTTPACYRNWNDDPGLTRYQAFIGPGTAFERPGLTWADFPDGRESTLLVVEAADSVPWSKPVDLTYDPGAALPYLGKGYTKPIHFLCREVGGKRGFPACFADGSVRFIRSSTDDRLIRSVITRNGGEHVDLADLE